MKKLVEITMSIKSFGAMIFAGLLILYTVIGGFFGLQELSFSLVWQALFIALIASGIYFVAFSESVFPHLKPIVRFLIFSIPTLAVLSVFALFFKWFPTDNIAYWLIFGAAYLLLFGILIVVVKMLFKITGKRYTDLLSAYQAKQDIE